MSPRRYFDHAATTPLKPAAQQALADSWAAGSGLPLLNPSSLHSTGRRARLALDSAREQLAQAVGAHPSEVIFTSGGTEADNLALKGLWWQRQAEDRRRDRIILPGVEHHAVLETAEWLEAHQGAQLVFAPVDSAGVVDAEAFADLLRDAPETIALATMMWANNETGAVQPVAQVARHCAEAGVPFHTDAVQAVGSVPVEFAASGASTLAISGHKLGAPVGVGALLVRRDVKLTPTQHGGGQERNIRSGTLDVAGARAFAAAAEQAVGSREAEAERLTQYSAELIQAVETLDGVRVSGPDPREHRELRLPGIVHITVEGAEGDSLLFMLDMAGFDTATGSACTAGVPRPSHVLLAMGYGEDLARGAQRFSLGWTTTAEDVQALVAALPQVIAQARSAGMAASVRG